MTIARAAAMLTLQLLLSSHIQCVNESLGQLRYDGGSNTRLPDTWVGSKGKFSRYASEGGPNGSQEQSRSVR
jgi:hypothetical protein